MKTNVEKLFINGKIYTFKDEKDTVEALAVDKGYIVWVGSTAEAKEKFDAAEVIDLEGKSMEPSMGDSHLHFYAYCQTLTTVDLAGCTTRKEAWDRLAKKAAETPEGMWIKGSNFDQSKWKDVEDRMPTADDLDMVTTKHPLIIKRCCLHEVSANHLALEKAGIVKDYVYGEGGLCELDENGYPNGVVREQASKLFDDIVPDPLLDPAFKEKLMGDVFKQVSSVGVTMMDTYAAAIWNFFEDTETYENLDKKGLLPVRMQICLENMYDKPVLTEEQKADPFRKVGYGTFKIFTDGSFGARSAALLEDYCDDPGNKGILVIGQDALNEKTYKAYKHGLQPATHCIGDAGTEAALQAIEYTVAKCLEDGMTMEEIWAGPKFRIIHAQLIHEDQLERFKKVPVIFDIQPVFLNTDLHWIEERIGDRAKDAYTWRRYIDEGFICTGGSDCPVEMYTPWPGIWGAVNRTDPLDNLPAGGWRPDQKVSKFEAACMYSKNMAYGNQMEKYLGTLEVGKFADMIVTDRDWLAGPDDDILNVKVLKTYLAGKEVYSAE